MEVVAEGDEGVGQPLVVEAVDHRSAPLVRWRAAPPARWRRWLPPVRMRRRSSRGSSRSTTRWLRCGRSRLRGSALPPRIPGRTHAAAPASTAPTIQPVAASTNSPAPITAANRASARPERATAASRSTGREQLTTGEAGDHDEHARRPRRPPVRRGPRRVIATTPQRRRGHGVGSRGLRGTRPVRSSVEQPEHLLPVVRVATARWTRPGRPSSVPVISRMLVTARSPSTQPRWTRGRRRWPRAGS